MLDSVNGAHDLSFESIEEMATFDAIARGFLAKLGDLSSTMSERKFRAVVAPFVLAIHDRGGPATGDDLRGVRAAARDVPIQDWLVFRSVSGAEVSSDRHVTLGPFALYGWPKHREALREVSPDDFEEGSIWRDGEYVLISVAARARDPHCAIQLADAEFRRFEAILRYVVGDRLGMYDVTVLEGKSRPNRRVLALADSGDGIGLHESKGSVFPVDMANPRITSESYGSNLIWTLLATPRSTELQKQIIRAVEWMGHGLGEDEASKAFVQFTFAMESLLLHGSKNPLDPSIASQFADASAFILYEDYEDRETVAKDVKRFYNERSDIVHGRVSTVNPESLENLYNHVSQLITKFLTDPELMVLRDKAEFQKWVTGKKYGMD